MESIRNQPKNERVLFENKDEEIKYNDYCLSCIKQCKQSFMVEYIHCKIKINAHTPKQYTDEILKKGKTLEEVGKEIGMNSRTVKSMLYERQDMTKELYVKLEKLLYNNEIK